MANTKINLPSPFPGCVTGNCESLMKYDSLLKIPGCAFVVRFDFFLGGFICGSA